MPARMGVGVMSAALRRRAEPGGLSGEPVAMLRACWEKDMVRRVGRVSIKRWKVVDLKQVRVLVLDLDGERSV